MRRHPWLIFAVMLLTALVVYSPALNGGPIWDDDHHMTAPHLRSMPGLWKIWTEPGATQQYYPLTHTVFWIQWHLWGEHTLGYHLVNVLLHAGAAFLVWRVVGELSHKASDTRPLPPPERGEGTEQAALLAAGIFLLHPVHVESVAWISELKNTMSAVFYLAAMRVYLRWRERRDGRGYRAALGLFVLALMSKSVTATLPAATLVIVWFKRGRLEWRGDARPLVPFFVIGIASGLFTIWVERKLVGAEGQVFELGMPQRLMLAGRVVWFYAGKLIWPEPLIFIYPRWELDAGQWRQWLGVAGVAVAAAGLWVWSGRPLGTAAKRGLIAGGLYFGGTLLPALGFFNVYPFRYSWVADHFQYLASLGVIVPLAWALSRLPRILGFVPLAVLAVMSFAQAGIYQGAERVYTDTIRLNPACWMAYNNLGVHWQKQGRKELAQTSFRHALDLNPDHAEAMLNLALLLLPKGEIDQARSLLERAVELMPHEPDALNNLASVVAQFGQTDRAIELYRRVLKLQPHYAQAMANLAAQLVIKNQWEQATQLLEQSVKLNPGYAPARVMLGYCLHHAGRRAQAEEQYRKAQSLMPTLAEAYMRLAELYHDEGRIPLAIEQMEKALELAANREDWKAMLEAWRKK